MREASSSSLSTATRERSLARCSCVPSFFSLSFFSLLSRRALLSYVMSAAAASLSSRQSACACACSASGRSAARPSTSAPSIPPSSSLFSSHRRLLRGSSSSRPSPVALASSMQPGELYIPDPLMDVSAIRAAAGAPGAAAGAGGGGGGRPRRRGPPDLPSLLMDGRIVYLGMPVRLFSVFEMSLLCVCLKAMEEEESRRKREREKKTKTLG